MSLRVWLPLTKDLRNQGLSNVTVTNNGATFNSAGKLGGAYSFNGSSNYLTVSQGYPGANWSYSVWVYTTSSSATQTLGCCSTAVGTAFSIFLIGGKIRIDPGANNVQWVTNYIYPVNTWFHFTVTCNNGAIKYYINGEYKESYSTTLASNQWGSIFSIGASQSNGSGYGNFLNGKLNDVRIYDHCLSPLEVKEISKGLVLHYPLNRGGLGPTNLLKNGFGELGTSNWATPSNISTTDLPLGQSDIKASFINNSTIEHIKIYPSHTYKLSFWIKATATSGYTYPSLFPYDVDGKFIDYYKCPESFNQSTMTTLKQQLKTGDTKIYVNDLSTWNANSGHYYNWAAIFSYTDGTGYTYPDGQYTQNCARFGSSTSAKTNLDKTNNIITLNSAYTGPTMPVGTKVCASTEGSTYYYPIGNINLATIQDWTYKEGTFSGNHNRIKYAKTVTFFTYSSNRMAGIKIQDLTNEGLDTNIEYDTSGYRNNGTRIGTFSYDSDTPKYNVSTVFPSGVNWINAGRGAMIQDSITISCWINYSTWGNPISCTEGGGWNFEEGNGGIRAPFYISGIGYKTAQSTITSTSLKNGWHMLTSLYDRINSTVKIFIDGELAGSLDTGTTNKIVYHGGNVIMIGAEAGGSATSPANTSFIGKISDVRIYATALSAEDIKSLYNNSAYIDNQGNIYGAVYEEV